jgi:hypothetical protein
MATSIDANLIPHFSGEGDSKLEQIYHQMPDIPNEG